MPGPTLLTCKINILQEHIRKKMFPEQPIHWECDEAFLPFLIPPLLYVPFFFLGNI